MLNEGRLMQDNISGPSRQANTSGDYGTSFGQPSGINSSGFPVKLYYLLQEEKYPDIISWGDNDDQFCIYDTEALTKLIPYVFGLPNFASFVRRLDEHKFQLVSDSEDENNAQQWTFSHPSFRRNALGALNTIRPQLKTIPVLSPIPPRSPPRSPSSLSAKTDSQVPLDVHHRLKYLEDKLAQYQSSVERLGSRHNELEEYILWVEQSYTTFRSRMIATLDESSKVGIHVPKA